MFRARSRAQKAQNGRPVRPLTGPASSVTGSTIGVRLCRRGVGAGALAFPLGCPRRCFSRFADPMASPTSTKIPVGTVLSGKYRVTREIGRGGMAAVYEAENVDIGKRVAIKVLAQELTTSMVVV